MLPTSPSVFPFVRTQVAAQPHQPIAVSDVVHYLVRAADLDAGVNRTIDVSMPEQLTYLG